MCECTDTEGFVVLLRDEVGENQSSRAACRTGALLLGRDLQRSFFGPNQESSWQPPDLRQLSKDDYQAWAKNDNEKGWKYAEKERENQFDGSFQYLSANIFSPFFSNVIRLNPQGFHDTRTQLDRL